MEPGVRKYLIRIVNTISMFLLWMAVNSCAGIMYGAAYWESSFTLSNLIFYTWLLASTALLIWYLYNKWKHPIDYNEE
jgi:hypothetical protein